MLFYAVFLLSKSFTQTVITLICCKMLHLMLKAKEIKILTVMVMMFLDDCKSVMLLKIRSMFWKSCVLEVKMFLYRTCN